MTGRRRRAFSFIAALAIFAGLTACSSSKSPSSTSNTTAAGSSATTSASGGGTATGSPINVGIICDCTGALASAGADGPAVYRAWASSVNAQGGLNGHPVKVFLVDTQSNPANATSAVQTLVNSDHAIALVDWSNLSPVFASAVAAAKVPVVGANVSELEMYQSPYFFSQGQTEDSLYASIIGAAKSAGATNLALFYCAEATQCQEGIKPLQDVGAQLGLPVVYTGEVAATAPNYTAQCLAAQQQHVTGLFIADIALVQLKAAKDCNQQGYHPIYVIDGVVLAPGDLTNPGLKDQTAAPVSNLPYFDTSSPAVQAMDNAVNKYAPGTLTNSDWNEFASLMWPAGLLLADAVKQGNVGANGATPTAAGIMSGLEGLNGDTLDGWAPPLTFPAGKAHPISCWFVAQVKNGQFLLPQGTKVSCQNG
ncbi:MAG: ABC transporter substrate-binding protein [Actinomycetota bacterium]|nr:ABC transporter substrate-binding protein [Actinomycetota bacterium]